MKFGLAALSAAALAATGTTAAESNELWIGILRASSDPSVQGSWITQRIQNASDEWNKANSVNVLWTELAEPVEENFRRDCATGLSYMAPDYDLLEVSSLFKDPVQGVSETDRAEFQKQVTSFTADKKNPYAQESVIKLINKMYPGYFSKNKFDVKLFWLTDATKMKSSACAKEKLPQMVIGSPFPALDNVVRFHKVQLSAQEFESCVQDESPVCFQSSEERDNCPACSIAGGNNAMVASAFGAAALVALALFF